MHYQGYKIRIYPTKEQEIKIWKHIGACRWLWNYLLDLQETKFKNGDKHLSDIDMCALIPSIKSNEETRWLQEISSKSLEFTCRNLHFTYQRFYKGLSGLPKFKSKKSKSRQAFRIRNDVFRFEKGKAFIEKVGWIKYKTDFSVPQGRCKLFHNTYVYYENGKYMLSFMFERENQTLKQTENSMGIDLGIKKTAVVSYGNEKIEYDNINYSKEIRRLEKKSIHLRRILSRKYRSSINNNGKYVVSKNIEKIVKELLKTTCRISNIRKNYYHQITHQLVMMAPARIVMESISISSLVKNKNMAKKILDQMFTTFIEYMKYKCEWHKIEFVQADRYFASSKVCSNCGSIKSDLKLSDRIYVCPYCGLDIDRDYNAAINLAKYVAQ